MREQKNFQIFRRWIEGKISSNSKYTIYKLSKTLRCASDTIQLCNSSKHVFPVAQCTDRHGGGQTLSGKSFFGLKQSKQITN